MRHDERRDIDGFWPRRIRRGYESFWDSGQVMRRKIHHWLIHSSSLSWQVYGLSDMGASLLWQYYTFSLPVMTSCLRNSKFRRTGMRSLPPVWYHCLSQNKVTISSALKPRWASWSRSV